MAITLMAEKIEQALRVWREHIQTTMIEEPDNEPAADQ